MEAAPPPLSPPPDEDAARRGGGADGRTDSKRRCGVPERGLSGWLFRFCCLRCWGTFCWGGCASDSPPIGALSLEVAVALSTQGLK
uniref:Uncharacterized protein n=1 Tax=Odontella aurita TaxID=265563 RepID=A0A7S4K7I5_9STRA